MFRDAARAAINRIGKRRRWDEQLLTGAESELRLTRLDVNDVDDAVDHVQTVLFNRLVATAHSMRLLGEEVEVVRRFNRRSLSRALISCRGLGERCAWRPCCNKCST